MAEAASSSDAAGASSDAAAGEERAAEQRPRSWTLQTAAGVMRGMRGIAKRGSTLSHELSPNIGDLSFVSFSVLLSVLFLFSFSTSSLLVIAAARADENGLRIGAFVQSANFAWIAVQIALLVDLALTYNRSFRPCRLCTSCCSCHKEPGSDRPESVSREITPASTNTPRVGDSDFRQPMLWRWLERCLGVKLSPRKYMLFLATVLPLNVLFFYTKIGSPVFTPTRFTDHEYDINALLSDSNWPEGGGLIVDVQSDVVTSVDGTLFPVEISSKECYSPESPEFRILARLHKEDTPRQAYCESLLGTAMVGFTEKHGTRDSWQQDEDVWEEGFDFIVRIFGALAGLVADKAFGTLGFLEDMTDVFDMYMLTFADVEQLHEGRPLLSGSHKLFWHSMSYQSWVSVFLGVAYMTMVFRALSLIGWTPLSNLVSKCGSPAPKNEIQIFTIALASLLFIEVPFLTMRWIGWYEYGIPVSVLAVKNIFHIYGELQLIGVFRAVEDGSSGKRRTPVCCFWRICYGSSSDSGTDATTTSEIGTATQV